MASGELLEPSNAPMAFGGLGGGDLGLANGTLNGRLALIDPNGGMFGRLVTPLSRMLSARSTVAPALVGATCFSPSTASLPTTSSAK